MTAQLALHWRFWKLSNICDVLSSCQFQWDVFCQMLLFMLFLTHIISSSVEHKRRRFVKCPGCSLLRKMKVNWAWCCWTLLRTKCTIKWLVNYKTNQYNSFVWRTRQHLIPPSTVVFKSFQRIVQKRQKQDHRTKCQNRTSWENTKHVVLHKVFHF